VTGKLSSRSKSKQKAAI